jgi:hypothetical protein
MPVVSDEQRTLYRPSAYENEGDFEASVVDLADQIFGPSTIYVDIKRRVKGNDIVSIPDGYLIDMTDPDSPRLFVIENEIVSHDPFKHIGIQMLKFTISFEGAQLDIRNFLMNEISCDEEKLHRLREGCDRSNSRNIDNYLDQAVYGDFRGIVLIDEAREELHRVLEKIHADISVLELRAFESEDGRRLHEFDTLYEEEEDLIPAFSRAHAKTPKLSARERARRRKRRAACDTIVVPARDDGFEQVFLGEDQWYQIRIGAAMKDRIKYIAAYRVAPISAVTHVAEVREIRPYKDTGKYIVLFRGAAEEIEPIPVRDPRHAPQGPVYVKLDDLRKAHSLDEALRF